MKPQRINTKTKFTLFYLFVAMLFSNVNFAQDDVIKVDTNLITVPATVLDRNGRYVPNLKKENFQIFENGIEQEVTFFESVEQPFTILFLIDVSSSMIPHKENLSLAVNTLTSRLRPNDQLMVLSFFQWTDLLLKPTKINELSKKVMFKIREDSDCPGTYLYNAVDDALKRLKKIRGRKAIVVFSDGLGTGFGITAQDNLRDAEEQEAIIYTLKFGIFPSEPPIYASRKIFFERVNETNAYMHHIAAITGGRNYQVENIFNLEETFKLVVEELGQQYSLGFYPKNQLQTGEKHQIKVKVRQPNLAVKGRDSYVVGEQKNKKK